MPSLFQIKVATSSAVLKISSMNWSPVDHKVMIRNVNGLKLFPSSNK